MTKFIIANRRSFLRISLFVGCMVFVRRADPFAEMHGSRDTVDLLSSKLASFFHNQKSARVVGLEYLRHVPAEANARQLTHLICSSWAQRYDEAAHADATKIKTILLRQQREDFEKGRIVDLQGWILSQTEARLCALAVLV